MKMRLWSCFIACSSFLMLGGWSGKAEESVEPPPEAFRDGRPVSMMKTLNEMEPRILIPSLPYAITNPGSYYLLGVLRGTGGIYVACSAVTIDLNGFGVWGMTNCRSHGIELGPEVSVVQVKNGMVAEWNGWGIYSGTDSTCCVMEDLSVGMNSDGGISVGAGSRLERVLVAECGGCGMVVGPASTVTDCKVTDNVGTGIVVGAASSVLSTLSVNNGCDGIFADIYCTVRDCTLMGNARNGIACTASCRVLECNIGNNGKPLPPSAGICLKGPGNQVKGNNITANGKGISVENMSTGNWIDNNSFIDNELGLEVLGTGNFIVRNCFGTPLATNGVHSFIMDDNQAAQILENMGSSFTNANPWANIRLTPGN